MARKAVTPVPETTQKTNLVKAHAGSVPPHRLTALRESIVHFGSNNQWMAFTFKINLTVANNTTREVGCRPMDFKLLDNMYNMKLLGDALIAFTFNEYNMWNRKLRSEKKKSGQPCSTTKDPIVLEPDATSRFLQCVGLPSTDTGKDHMQRLKVMLEATMDVYTFMKSSMTGVPVLSLEGALNFNPGADPLQNEALVQMWLEVKIKPLLGSITKHFLSCLSTKNFSCSTYQTVVRELSKYFSEMNPVRQKWIYTFFMYPFLSGERVAGCVNGNESSEEWLMKNFGAFRAMARMEDFTSLNMVFSGLEVLHLLSPAQKAELLLKPEVAGLDNGTLTLVFKSLLPGQQTTPSPGNSSVAPFGYSSPPSTLKEIANGFMTVFRPIGSFAHEFVSFTRQRDVSEIKSTTLTQFLLNWTLAELADVYEPPTVPDIPQLDVTNVEDWYQQVVLPLLRRFLPNDEDLMHQNITLAFHELYFLEHGGENEYDELQDVCSVTLDKSPCGLTDAVENVAHIMHCAAKSELTMTEASIMRLITELAERLQLLIKEFTTTNFAELASDIKEIFNENEPPTLTQHHLDDPEFIKLWYQIKLLPLLPDVNPDLLSCLSTKNFSCPVYQTLVAALGESMRQMDADMMYSHNIYRYFIYSFLNHNTTEPQCISSANQSAEWVKLNFGFFSSFASVIDFYQLNPGFSVLEALQVLTPKQLAEMLLLPLPDPTDKDTVMHAVFDFLLESPEDRKFTDVLHFVVQLAKEANPPCSVYQLIFERMYRALRVIPPDLEPVIWARIDDLMGIAPAGTSICRSINSSVLQSYLNNHTHVSCSFTLEEYACAQLEDFTAEQLASLMRCNLPGNGSHSRVLWKLLLTKLSSVLNPALDMLANTSVGMIPSAEAILDVIQEMRLSVLTDGELMNSSVIHVWFTERLSVFLPSASGRFLLCLTSRNLSCPSYQQILQVFVGHFEKMPFQQQLVVLKDFILRFLLNAHSGPGCLSSFNNSAQWLTDNLGPFSEFVIVSELIRLNPLFKPLEALHLLTPNQTAELLGLTRPENTDTVINTLFDYMTEAPEDRRFTKFLSALVMFSKTLNLSCSSYKTLFTRLDDAMATATSDVASAITYTKLALFKQLPSDPACSSNTVSSSDWMQKNLGGFSVFVSIQELQMLYPNFSPMEALPSLSVGQLVDLSTTPGLLTTPDQVAMVMKYVPDQMLAVFFDEFSVAIKGNEHTMSSAVRSAMLEVVFNRANLSHPSVEDSVVSEWLNNRLPPLVVSLIPSQVNPYFQILVGRNCSIEQQGVTLLNSTILTLTPDSQKEIYNHIVLALKALRCYGIGSFYRFVEDSFLGFQFPNLTTFLSLMPRDQKHLLVNSMPPSDLGNLLRRPGVVDNGAQLCDLYSSYVQTPVFLETVCNTPVGISNTSSGRCVQTQQPINSLQESLPVDVRRPTLPCVWPMALSSTRRSEVNAWFDRSLQNYLVFLSKSLISPDVTHNTSCLAFQKLVSVLGQYNYTAVDFVREDVFNTIRNYLQSATPRCYDPTNPELNSTAWFAEYIGPFMPFLTLEVLQTFGSDKTLQVFTVNPLNIALLNHSVLPQNLTNYYTALIYQQDSNFNPLLLPLLCRCVAPGMAFTQLTPGESMIMLQSLTIVCQNLNSQISAALTNNFGNNINSNTISALGNESTSMSMGQIKAIPPQQLVNALFTLSNVIDWNEGQAKSIIESLMTVMQINDSSSLFTLGTLVIGVPSRVFRKIHGSEILVASRNPSLVGHMMSAPKVVQQIFVTQILSVNSTSEAIIQNVPDEMATEIPRVFLQSFTAGSITKLNKMKWKRQQAELFFGEIAVESATAVLGSANNLSSSVLQGFTCTSVRTIEKVQVKNLVKACRRKGTNKVKLVESQLTCMFNRIRGEPDINSFDLFPPDVLLYYDYSLVPQSNCRLYFEQLSDADFSVFSSELSYKRTALFDNARNCLGITTTNLTRAQITVLGNMCCYLNASYILNSDEFILEKLKTCPDLSAAQAAAVETRLISGTTRYRLASTWTETTLRNLDIFPLYMSSGFYANFDKTTKRSFLRYYLKVLKTDGVSREKIGEMKAKIRQSIRSRAKRQTVTECTAGEITKVIIYDDTFPFDYDDINQFNSCLSAVVVRDNLEVITQKVDQQDYLKIVLSKLQEAYSTIIPEDQVQMLGPASRVASADQVNRWNITQVDTLASLMDTTNGTLDPSLVGKRLNVLCSSLPSARAIISKYLSVEGNKLDSVELNAIRGPNLCSLDIEVLGNISQQSLRNADALDVSNCTSDKLKVLFNITLQAFQTTTRSSVPLYPLIQPYLGGASSEFVKRLSASNINMDLQTFVNLDKSVVQSLLVREVATLLGDNLPDLKSFENTPIVRSWISSQLQSELNTLNIGITGGRADSSVTTSSTATTKITTTAVTTAKTTKGAGARIHGDVAGFTFFVFLALLVSSNQVGQVCLASFSLSTQNGMRQHPSTNLEEK
ncbi:hypothetical protein CCH79_00015043, partial [Gambusia affinis]